MKQQNPSIRTSKVLDNHGRPFLMVNEGYVAAGYDRRSTRGWTINDTSPNNTSKWDLDTIKGRARDLYRNTPLASAAIDRPVDHVVGSGLDLHVELDRKTLKLDDTFADEWEDDIERRFYAWANNPLCDITEQENFYDLQSQAFRNMFMTGDIFTLLPIKSDPDLYGNLRIALYEGDMVSSPNGFDVPEKIIKGVEIDSNGAATGYHFSNVHPNGETLPTSWKLIKKYGSKSGRRQVIHMYKRKRPGQQRGVSILAPVIESIKQMGRFAESELMAAVVSSFFTVFIKQEGNSEEGNILQQGIPVAEQVLPTGSQDFEMGSGNIIGLNKGEGVEFGDPKRPSGNFEPFYNAYLAQIGMSMGIPYEVLTLRFNSSYSAARAALLEAWNLFKIWRMFVSRYWCTPIYKEWLSLEILSGRVSAPGFFEDPLLRAAWCGASWIGSGMGMIDPVKETEAAKDRIDYRLSNHETEYARNEGGDWASSMHKLAREKEFLEKNNIPLSSRIGNNSSESKSEEKKEEENVSK
jgi:lambda family phage portal protein